MSNFKELTSEQKKRYHLCKRVDNTFPTSHVWKMWTPLPDTMFGGIWLQYSSPVEAFKDVKNSQEEINKFVAELFDDGGW